MQRNQVKFLYLNLGHFLDHLFMLVFASVAALRLNSEWEMSYAELIPYATPGFVAFGIFALLAGWVADKWSREGMIVIFFIGIGASSLIAGMANSPLQIAAGLTLIGIFAAIYHPVGLAMVVQGRARTGVPLAINGIFGNLGVASAALLTGFLIDNAGWRSAFYVPGVVSILVGFSYWYFVRNDQRVAVVETSASAAGKKIEQGAKFVGKEVIWTSPAGKKIVGKISSAHGNKGLVRAIFERGLPGQAVTTEIEVSGEAKKEDKKEKK